MAGRRKKLDQSNDFWCINCGNKGIPIIRPRSSRREPGHMKALYCCHCRMVINHVETRDEEEKLQFQQDFSEGKYKEKAEESIRYAKEHKTH